MRGADFVDALKGQKKPGARTRRRSSSSRHCIRSRALARADAAARRNARRLHVTACASSTACRCWTPSRLAGRTGAAGSARELCWARRSATRAINGSISAATSPMGAPPLITTSIERDIRPFATGRKVWLFSDTVAGAKASAMIYSLCSRAAPATSSRMRTCSTCSRELPQRAPEYRHQRPAAMELFTGLQSCRLTSATPCATSPVIPGRLPASKFTVLGYAHVPARIVWTRVCNSGGLFHGGCVTGFMG